MRLEKAALQNWSCGCESKKKKNFGWKLQKAPGLAHGPPTWKVNSLNSLPNSFKKEKKVLLFKQFEINC